MLLVGKTQKKHPGDLLPTVPDLPPSPLRLDVTSAPCLRIYLQYVGLCMRYYVICSQ